METNYSYTFGVINLPLDRELQCGEVLIEPIPEGQAELKKRNSFDYEPVVSAVGVLSFPSGLNEEQRRDFIRKQSLNSICLLLSFATRRFVEIVLPRMERLEGGQWVRSGGELHFPMTGKPHGVGWYMDHDELQAYMDQCLPILVDTERGQRQGLGLALQMYRTNFQQEYMELRYLKNWIALEILFAHNSTREHIMSENRFKRVRRGIRDVLTAMVADDRITQEEQDRVTQKLPELNRSAAASECHAFLTRIFEPYPAQDVTADEVATFIKIRNEITHGGVMGGDDGYEYSQRLNQERARLKALLERVILAMLGQHPNLMSFTWRTWKVGR